MQRISVTAIAALALIAGAAWESCSAQGRNWHQGYVPNLPVVTQDGKAVNFYDDLIKDKIVVINFIYTSCPDICPLSTARMAQLEEKLGKEMGRDIFFISMTVDPEHDTPEKLKAYAKAYDAGPGWTFVAGKPEDIRAINYKFGDRSGGNLSDHRNEIVLGNDATGEWQRDSIFSDLDRVVLTIRSMDPKYRDEVRAPRHGDTAGIRTTGDAPMTLTNEPGQALYRKLCAPCHTVGVGDRVGPDLRGVADRRDHEWLVRFIQNPAKVRAEKDPMTVAMIEKFPGVRMPSLGVTENDANDLITYLTAQTARMNDAGEAPVSSHDHSSHDHSAHDHPADDHAAHEHHH
jgi:protein SCO1/2